MVWVRFQDTSRVVVLDRGEAYFEVAKDPKRPFVVRAGDAAITAIGTAFNVLRNDDRVQVDVAEGMVNVKPDPSDTIGTVLTRGKQLRVDHQWAWEPAKRVAKVTTSTPETASAWRSGRLAYIAEPLKHVVADVNRYSSVQISLEDPQLGELPVTGTIFESDIDGWLNGLEQFMPVEVERHRDRVVVRERPSAR